MARFKVTAKWEGEATTEIEADDENRAEEIARMETWCGFVVEGGHVDFDVTEVEQV